MLREGIAVLSIIARKRAVGVGSAVAGCPRKGGFEVVCILFILSSVTRSVHWASTGLSSLYARPLPLGLTATVPTKWSRSLEPPREGFH
jgi:hypothetical protein